jgi:hypothetical protein
MPPATAATAPMTGRRRERDQCDLIPARCDGTSDRDVGIMGRDRKRHNARDRRRRYARAIMRRRAGRPASASPSVVLR